LYVGNCDNAASGASIFRVSLDDRSVSFFGAPVWDPDAVIYDGDGLISGKPGSVLTGGGCTRPSHITAIYPDGTAHQLWPPPPVAFNNPRDMVFDSTGRLLFTDSTGQGVFETSGENPTSLISLPSIPDSIVVGLVDEVELIIISTRDGYIRPYNLDGKPLDDPFDTKSSGSATLAFGPGGSWGTSLYAIENASDVGDGNLVRFDPLWNRTVVGTGFDSYYTDMTFGADGFLYISDCGEGRILQVTPEPTTLLLLGLGGLALLRKRMA